MLPPCRSPPAGCQASRLAPRGEEHPESGTYTRRGSSERYGREDGHRQSRSPRRGGDPRRVPRDYVRDSASREFRPASTSPDARVPCPERADHGGASSSRFPPRVTASLRLSNRPDGSMVVRAVPSRRPSLVHVPSAASWPQGHANPAHVERGDRPGIRGDPSRSADDPEPALASRAPSGAAR